MIRRGQDDDIFGGPFPLGSGRSFGAVLGRNRGVEVDGAIADRSSAGANAGAQQMHYVGLSVPASTVRITFLAIGLFLTAVLFRAAQIQVSDNAYYGGLAEGNRSRIEWIPSERGVIYDRDGAPLVRNVPVFSAGAVPADLPGDPEERRRTIAALADVAGAEPMDIEAALEEFPDDATYPVPVASGLSHEEAVRLRILSADMPGIALLTGTTREYLRSASTPSLSHLLGYMGRVTDADLAANPDLLLTDAVGKTGLERTYESELRGTYGKRRVEVDALGRRKTIIAEEPGAAGRSLVTSIDLELQEKAEEALKAALRREGKTRGSVIVMDPDTGEVLAMVSEPSFDDNLFAQGISAEDFSRLTDDPDNPLFPRAISASLPSGSTFKLVVAAAALDEGIVTPRTTFLSTGGIAVDRWFFPDWKAGGHGYTDLAKAIADSVNTYFYIVGGGYEDREGLGVARITDHARRFGLGSRLGIDLPGENSGFLPSKEWKERVKDEPWYVGDTYHLAIGQGDILVTPLQIATMTSVFANGGALMRPHLVSAVTAASGGRTVVEPEAIEAQAATPDAVAAVRAGMRRAVTQGSARSLALLPVAVAGKTGTAQWSSTRSPHAWFTSFAPYDDPEIVVTVVIEEGNEGSVAATPVAAEIYRWYFGVRQ